MSESDVGREAVPSPFSGQDDAPGTAAAVAPVAEAATQEPATVPTVPGPGTHVQAPGEFRIDW